MNLLGRGSGVADAGNNTRPCDVFDVVGSAGPLRRKRHHTHVTLRGVLPASKFIEIGRPNPLAGMGSAGSIVGRDMGALDMEGFHRMTVGQ